MLLAKLESPTKLRIADSGIKKLLTYEDKKVTYEWLKWNKIQKQDDAWIQNGCMGRRHWFIEKNSREELDQKVAELKADMYKCLLFGDEGGYYTYSGLLSLLKKHYGNEFVVPREYKLPEWGLVPWANRLKYEPRWYQLEALNRLAPEDKSRSHGAVEIGTGLGKTFIMALILQRIGLPAVIIVPTLSIADQMLKDMTYWFGPSRVGQYFRGKKQASKMFVVAVSKSLMNVQEGTDDYKLLSNKKILLCDESHLIPAESLSKIALGLFSEVPYRYFFSGTQMRKDGLELLLESIIGDVVFEMSVKEGVDQGFLTKPLFFQWRVRSNDSRSVEDPIEANRVHLHYNKKVNEHAVKLAKHAVDKGRRVLIMIDEVEQFIYLKNAGLLDLDVRFAHGGIVDKKQKSLIPVNFHKSNPMSLVADFDKGLYPVLVGTSCISMGTDIKSVDCIIDIVGLSSEIRVRQSVGRGTRLFEGKRDCIYNDYMIYNIDALEKHAKKRMKFFNSIYGVTKILEAK